MANCNTKRWKFPHYFHHYFCTYGKCTKTRELKWFREKLFCLIVTIKILPIYKHQFTKTGLVDSTEFITVVLKMQRFVSFVSKRCLLVPFHLKMLKKHLLKQDLETGKICEGALSW